MKTSTLLIGSLVLGGAVFVATRGDAAEPEDSSAPGATSPGWPGIPSGEQTAALPPNLLAMFQSALYSTDPDAIMEVAEELAAEGYSIHAGILEEMAEILIAGGSPEPPIDPGSPPPEGAEIDPWTALGQAVAGMTPEEAAIVIDAMQTQGPDQLEALAWELRRQGYEAAAVLLEARADELRASTLGDVTAGVAPGGGAFPVTLAGETPREYIARVGG